MESPLAPHLRLVRLRAEAALVRRLNAGYGFADARIPAEVYLRDDDARERLTRASVRPRLTHEDQERELAAAIAAAEAALDGHTSRLTELGDRLRLDAAERALIAVAIAYDLDGDVRDLCQALAGRRRPALYADVCQELAPALADAAAALRALHASGTLVRAGLIVAAGDLLARAGGAALGSQIAAGRRAIDWLLGDERIADPVGAVARVADVDDLAAVHLDDGVATQVERIAAALARAPDPGEPPVVLLQGPEGAGKAAAAARLAKALGRPLVIAPVPELLALERDLGRRGLIGAALCEAQLRGALAYLPGIESLEGDGDAGGVDRVATAAIERHADVVLLATRQRGAAHLAIDRPFHLVRVDAARLEARTAAWHHSLAALGDDADVAPDDAEVLAGRYVIGPGAIHEVTRDARRFARATGERVGTDDLDGAVARRLSLRLGSFGRVITRRARFEEMVLPEDIVETLHDIVAMVRGRTQILERWGYGDHLGLTRGVAALFSGEPGTGKTMAASAISGTLGLELVRIDLSAVMSRWVGETEKHLARIFDEAQSANAMLLFDEADSLFGKRTKLESAQDRFANLEVNYILQRMETFDGVSILTTNMESAVDPAFLRRLNFRVRFPEPDIDEREELWRRLLPPDTGIAADVDFRALAEGFDMTGGHIRNAVVRAAVVASKSGRAMTPEDLATGAKLEYGELGKITSW